MRHLASLLLLVLVGGAPPLLMGCKSDRARASEAPLARPVTVGALVRRAINALRSGDTSAYVALLATASEATRACPDRFANRGPKKMRERWLRSLEEVKAGVSACHSKIPWKRVRETSRKGGQPSESLDKCAEPVQRLSDITMVFEADRIQYEVVLKRPYVRRGAVYGFAAGPLCGPQKEASTDRK